MNTEFWGLIVRKVGGIAPKPPPGSSAPWTLVRIVLMEKGPTVTVGTTE